MRKYAGENKDLGPLAATISIQYGKQPDIESEWKKIISVEDVEERKKQIDKLLETMEQNSEQNGFFGSQQEIVICKKTNNSILFNDKDIYYQFFNTLRNFSQLNKDGKFTEGAIIKKSIEEVEKTYWGGFGSKRDVRLDKTKAEVVDDSYNVPSVSNLKGQNCSACVERAVMSHNLWLLAGKTSYFVNASAKECDFGQEDAEYSDDGHAYNIVEYDGVYRLFDLSMNNICVLPGDPIKDIESGTPLRVDGPNIENPGYYANFTKVEQQEMTE